MKLALEQDIIHLQEQQDKAVSPVSFKGHSIFMTKTLIVQANERDQDGHTGLQEPIIERAASLFTDEDLALLTNLE